MSDVMVTLDALCDGVSGPFFAKDCLPRMSGVLPGSRRTPKDLSGKSEKGWICEMLIVSVGCNCYLGCSVRWGFPGLSCKRLPPTNGWRTFPIRGELLRILSGMSEEG